MSCMHTSNCANKDISDFSKNLVGQPGEKELVTNQEVA